MPLYYENRVPRMQLITEHLTEDIEQILESAELDETQESRLAQEFAIQYQCHHAGGTLRSYRRRYCLPLYGTGLPRQGDGHLDRQSHRRQDVRQGAEALGKLL